MIINYVYFGSKSIKNGYLYNNNNKLKSQVLYSRGVSHWDSSVSSL